MFDVFITTLLNKKVSRHETAVTGVQTINFLQDSYWLITQMVSTKVVLLNHFCVLKSSLRLCCRQCHCVFGLSVCHICAYICLFVHSSRQVFFTTISRERLEQSWWNLRAIFTRPYRWPD